jgi:hypothetical protein
LRKKLEDFIQNTPSTWEGNHNHFQCFQGPEKHLVLLRKESSRCGGRTEVAQGFITWVNGEVNLGIPKIEKRNYILDI